MTKFRTRPVARLGLFGAAFATAALGVVSLPAQAATVGQPGLDRLTGGSLSSGHAHGTLAYTLAQANCGKSVTGPVPIGDTVLTNGGIRVHKCLAPAINVMEARAATEGVQLKGWGWRDTQRQIELRIANCGGDDYYTIYEKPSSECNPPTARPGRSMHERGLAVDFYSPTTSSSITGSSSQFSWLKKNASQYGVFNLPSETWHWSTNGN